MNGAEGGVNDDLKWLVCCYTRLLWIRVVEIEVFRFNGENLLVFIQSICDRI
jgi:hypothetical protein